MNTWSLLLIACTLTACGDTERIDRDMDTPPEHAWNDQVADDLIGRHILVGLTYLKPDGSVDRLEQVHGIVVRVDRNVGIEIQLTGERAGQTKWLPPDTSAITTAAPGTYTLKETGEEVSNPDFMSTWTVSKDH